MQSMKETIYLFIYLFFRKAITPNPPCGKFRLKRVLELCIIYHRSAIIRSTWKPACTCSSIFGFKMSLSSVSCIVLFFFLGINYSGIKKNNLCWKILLIRENLF